MITQKKESTRRERLGIAAKAHSNGNMKNAIDQYLLLLRADPGDYDIHARLAPLLAASNKKEEAWHSFHAAADGYRARDFLDKAQGLYTLACRTLPHKIETWEETVKLQIERGLKADAVQTAIEACQYTQNRLNIKRVTILLRKVYMLVPWHPELTMCLARFEAKEKRKKEAVWLYEGIAQRYRGKERKKACYNALIISPTPGRVLRLLKALLFFR